MWSCSIFFCCHSILTLVAASIFLFLTATIKFSCCSSNEIGLLCVLISGSSSSSVIHANVDFKIKLTERIGFVVVVFLSLKVRVAMWFTAEARGYLKCKISPQLTWRGGRTYGHTPCRRFSQNQNFLDAYSLPNFLTHDALLHALCAQELRFK